MLAHIRTGAICPRADLRAVHPRTPRGHIIWHLIDECIKWTVAIKIVDKETAAILEAMTEH